MALVFPTPAQAALQTPVNTFSPSSTPLVNTSNGNTYTYIPAKGVWVLGTSGGVVVSVGVVSPLTSTGGTNPIISIDPASTVASGAVQLNDTTNSPSTTQAATARAVCAAANLAVAAIPCACLLAKGDILGASGASTPTALPVGADGLVLTACAAAATGLCWAPGGGGGGGTVTSITAGTGLTGGTITTTGTVALDVATNAALGGVIPDGTNITVDGLGNIDLGTTGVAAGAYTYASITVDAQGRLTVAGSGTAPNTTVSSPITNSGTAVAPVIGIQDATTGQKGAVQVGTNIDVAAGVISVADATYTLPADPTSTKGVSILNATTTQTVKGQALDATIGKTLQDQINSLLTTSNLTLVGTFDATAATVGDLTAAGTAAGFTAGADLLAPAPALLDYYVIVTTPGSYSPPGGGGPYNANQGDWFLCDGAQWIYLNVGYDAPVASTTNAGIVELATNAETQTGTDSTRAVTPAGAASTYIPLACLTGKGAILGASAAGTPSALPVGADGKVLFACSTAANGLCWEVIPEATPIASGKVFGYTGAAVNCNVSLGYCALGSAGTLGIRNVAIGYEALRDPGALGDCLTAVGYQALRNSTTGFWLTAVGACALCSNTTGCGNTAVGTRALLLSTTTSRNTAVGAEASLSNSSGSENTSVGFNASYYTTTGGCNTSVGSNALLRNTSGSSNTAVGNCALQGKETGSGNTAVGHKAMAGGGCVNPVIALNTALGCEALVLNDFGCDNIAVGVGSLGRLICGSCNIAIGCQAGFTYVSECGNVILGRWNGTSLDCNTLALADGGGNLKLKFNCDGALSFDGLAYGTAGQVLQSNGPGAKPTWVAAGGGGGGTVTSITAGTGLTGGTITSSGTIALGIATTTALGGVIPDGANISVSGTGAITLTATGVAAGAYPYACVCVDVFGRITSISCGFGPSTTVNAPLTNVGTPEQPNLSISQASTASCGAVELATEAETIAGISPSLAVTPLGAKCTYVPKNIVFKGALITACTPGNPVGQGPGTDGQVLVSNSFTNTGLEWQNKYAAPNTYGFVIGCTDATNAALGCAAIFQLTSGTGNSALGCGSGSGITTGSNNVAVGFLAGCAITTGSNNVAIGCGAQVASATGSCQLAIGYSLTCNWLTGNSTKAIKPGAGIIDCANSCGTAGQVLLSTGANGICWGGVPGASPATATVAGLVFGCQSSAVSGLTSYGYGSGAGGPGASNSSFGYCALAGAAGAANTALGYNSQQFATGNNNVSAGCGSLFFTNGACNVAIGNCSMSGSSSSSNNTAVGHESLCSLASGNANVALGWAALCRATNPTGNTSIGAFSLCGVTTGCFNLGVGTCSGNAITTGSCNVTIGFCAQVASPTLSCQLAIGFSATDNWLTGNSTKAIRPGAGVIDCAVSCGTANMVLTSQGNAIQWKSVASTIAVPNYGSFLSTVSQTNLDTTNGNKVTYNTTTESRNVSVVDGSKLTVAVAGTYNIQMSMQVTKTDAGTDDMTFWFKKNGVNIDNSATNLTLEGNNNAQLASLNFVITLSAGDYIEIWWYSVDTNVVLLAEPAAAPAPAIPSIIATVVPVGA